MERKDGRAPCSVQEFLGSGGAAWWAVVSRLIDAEAEGAV